MKILLQTKFAVASFDDLLCESCNDARAVIRCEDCLLSRHICGKCDLERHESQPFHDRQVILNGFSEPIPEFGNMNGSLLVNTVHVLTI